jgi:type IV pilus assembly protein PilX
MRLREYQKGMALVSALLLLLVTTMLGVAMFRSFGFLEIVAGNTREKQRALHAAESAQNYAEWWLGASSGLNATVGSNCGAVVTSMSSWTVCSNTIANPATIPWTAGMSYTPMSSSSNAMTTGSLGTINNYASAPLFYISFLSTTAIAGINGTTNTYQIDALGYGGTTNSAAVAESGYTVTVAHNSMQSLLFWTNHGGP